MQNEENNALPENTEFECKSVTLTDEQGNENEYILTDPILYEGKNYAVFVVNDPEDSEVVIAEIEEENEENEATLAQVQDEELLNKLFDLFKQRNADSFDFE